MEQVSLIWSAGDDRKSFIDFNFIDDLNLKTIFNINSMKKAGDIQLELRDFFTVNRETISLRNELFQDLLENRDIFDYLKELVGILEDILQLYQIRHGHETIEANLYAIKELEMYIEVIKKFHGLFRDRSLKCPSLGKFVAIINEIFNSDEFARLCRQTEKLDHHINNIKSITVGVNLDAQFMPVEAGIVSINDQSYVSGNVIDKILRLDFSKNDFECMAPLEPIKRGFNNEQRIALAMSINSGIYSVFSRSMASWKSAIKTYSGMKISWLCGLLPEFYFIIGCMEPLITLYEKNYPLCSARFGEKEHVSELYNAGLALHSSRTEVVRNSLWFDDEGRIYILTGPNQGGKSIYTYSVGLLYAMLHLGVLLPAREACLSPVDNIFTYFPARKAESYGKGRFATECADLSAISRKITGRSLFLFDECLSSTSSVESTVIAKEVLSAYARIGCKGIFTTHLHDLCRTVGEINTDSSNRSRVENLSAQIDATTGERSFKIVKGDVLGESFAYDIARKYRLTKDDILAEKSDLV